MQYCRSNTSRGPGFESQLLLATECQENFTKITKQKVKPFLMFLKCLPNISETTTLDHPNNKAGELKKFKASVV